MSGKQVKLDQQQQQQQNKIKNKKDLPWMVSLVD
jgi:hypothetical protein